MSKSATPRVALHGREFTEDMAEISGFGGSYEAGCRLMILAGLKWLADNATAEPKIHGYRNIVGVAVEDNDDAKTLTKTMMDAPITREDGTVRRVGDDCTGAMHEFSLRHIFRIKAVGWDTYQQESRALRLERAKSDCPD